MTESQTRLLFRTAAVFNVAASLPFLFAGRQFAELMGVAITPSSLVFIHIAGLAICGFGWAYWQAGNEPQRNRAIIQLGMALKIGVVVIAAAHWMLGSINALLPAMAAGDLVYAGLFWIHLRTTPAISRL